MSPWIYLLKLYRPRRLWLLSAFLSLAITWLAGAILLALSGWFITASAMAGVGLILNLNIFTPSTAIRALAILRTLGRYAERIIGHEAILRVLTDLRVRTFTAFARQPAKQESQLRHADLVNRLTADVDTLDGVPLRVIGPLFAALLTWTVCTIIGGIWGGTLIAFVIGMGGMITFLIAIWGALRGRSSGQAVVAARAEQRTAIMDYIKILPDLLAYQKQQSFRQKLQLLDHKQVRRLYDQERLNNISEHAVQAMTATMGLIVLALSSYTLSAPLATLLTLMTIGMNESLGTLPGACWRIGESLEASNRLMKLEATHPESEGGLTIPVSELQSLVRTNKLSVAITDLLSQRQPIQSNPLNFSLKRGRPLVIDGKSGSGKSSLMATMAGELAPVAGKLLVNGIDLLQLRDVDRYQLISFISQSDHVLDMTIREFLTIGVDDLPDARLREALEVVELIDTVDSRDDGLDFRLGIGGSQISGGQARRLQLAAILLRNPSIVLLDEPFRGLQPDLVKRMLLRLEPWFNERFCVIVTHDPDALLPSWDRLHWPYTYS